ncbi:SO2930 family diheme c-type cytochrome [Ideonella sp.]|uniref:SO2930 family diheme c-type cytochrome n=1 Tax=Ideonella sp. TaxID=1929293 RepID=UPI002B48831A|nr:SO2930 family diheme c-type cytochrome [Ideonella sp.]HJV67996.1 SO2930 family diheme c-type cytochrome [Ideonella sp.]
MVGALACIALATALAGCQRAQPPVNYIAEGKPAKLSDWHVVEADGARLRLNAGVLPYDLNTPLFSDHAHKLRTVWMPAGQPARYDAEQAFDFPVGTIITKTFYYPKVDGAAAGSPMVRQTAAADAASPAEGLDLGKVRLIETRVLVRRDTGWDALPYVWNDEQTDAVLERTGDQRALELVDDAGRSQRFTYVVPNENQCASCHVVNLKQKVFTPIGPKARHLNRALRYADGSENQLARWMREGYLAGVPGTELPRAADWRDERAPLAERARAYLDINCAHCHQANATASNTALRLDAFAPVDWHMGVCKSPVAAGKGTGDRLYGIVPGQPDASIMAWRMASTEGGVMMPELGRNTVHEEGLQLVRQWIASLPGRCTSP